MSDRADSHEEPAEDDEPETDGGLQAHTVRLELVDEPGELLRTLEPIAERGANLLSIHHERGNITPRGHIPVEVDIECPPDRFEGIVDALREAGVNVVQAGANRYGEEVNVVLVGHLVETDLSDTLSAIEDSPHTSVIDLSLAAPEGMDAVSSARVRLAVNTGRAEDALATVREIADAKEFCVVEPLPGGET
ncbi:amino acid-binding protein [Natronobiforma cellulositropha]|uniref:amino acid-binding protein n=1 Tax=Natronobiforma cellulositropha TaxID=1679076 RepID=UPI0021D6042A|nr:amino acid-binding protein [Natronobiforma cellulositropha]